MIVACARVVGTIALRVEIQPADDTRRIDILLDNIFDPLVFALSLGVLLGLFLLALEILTVTYVWIRSRRDTRREWLSAEIREEIYTRLVKEDPDWETWAETLSKDEHVIAKKQLDSHLRKLSGRERSQLQQAAVELGIADESVTALQEGDRNDRLIALKWLTLLEHPVEPEMASEQCRDDPIVRGAAARLLYETAAEDAVTIGTSLLLEETSQPMTSFGVDTLYRLHRDEPAVLFEYAADHVTDWTETLTIQVLLVISEFTFLDTDAPTGWLLDRFDADSPAIRAATARALIGYGWHETLRAAVPVSDLARDPSPIVRRGVCEMLISWGDEKMAPTLELLASVDDHPRVRIAAAQGLLELRRSDDPPSLDSSIDPVWRWVTARQESMSY